MKIVKKYIKSKETKNFLIYSGGSFVAGISLFLVIMLLTSKLSVAEFGQMELITTYSTFLSILFTFGLTSLLMIDYHQLDSSGYSEMLRDIIALVFVISGIGMSLILGITLIFKTQIFSGPVSSLAIIFGFGAYFLNLFLMLFYQVFVISAKAAYHSFIRILATVGLLALSYFFLEYLHLGLWGYFLGFTIINLLALLISGVLSREYLAGFNFRISKDRIIKYLRAGFPFMISALSAYLITVIDRWVILYYFDAYNVGIYAAAMRFWQGYETILIGSLINVYTAYIYKQFAYGNFKQRYGIIIPGILLLFAFLAIITPLIARLLIPESYEISFQLMPWIILGYGVGFIYFFPSLILSYKKKNNAILLIAIISLLFQLAINFLFINEFGLMGAVYSIFCTSLFKTIINFAIAYNLLKVQS